MMQTAATHARILDDLADRLDPDKPVPLDPNTHAQAAQELRTIAQHLHRIATGGDAKAADEAGD